MTERGTMIGGRNDGLVERFDARGRLREHATYKNGREEGVAIELRRRSDGQLFAITATTYNAGKREGIYREQGRLDDPEERRTYIEGHYENGEKTGRWLTVEGKHIQEVAVYIADKVDGERDWYGNDGALFSRGFWKLGKQQSERTYSNGRVASEIEFANGKKTRERELDASGRVTRLTEYDDEGRAKSRKIAKGDKLVEDPDFDP